MASPRGHASYVPRAPRHPVAQLQGPFEESMLEFSHDDDADANIYLDPVARRNTLLEAPTYTRVIAGRWKKKPGERFHPLWKLIAQISFGIHLLAEGMARSEDEVMLILQAHVDEIDGFLERTTEDFDLAQEDIQERLRCLKLPLSHPATFDKMLEDRNFRLSIVEGNEKIEHIVERTTQAMKDSLKDVQKGFDSTSCLEIYLQDLGRTWHRQSMEHEAVFVAMLGNVEGWRKAYTSLHMQGSKLNGALKKLTDIINEMQARAGEVSRRLLHQARREHPQVMGRPVGRTTPVSRFQAVPNKQLPTMPDRPALRQTVSHDTVRPTARTASQETLRQQALLSRSQTPQYDMPAPRHVNKGSSPRVIQIGNNSQARVQSMAPSLIDAAPPPRAANMSTKGQAIMEEEEKQPERYFPPVELPAHVPEETMRAAPLSKQNRLSSGLGLVQGNRTEKRTSRLATSALLDLLRSTPPKTKSSEASRSASTVVSSIVAGDSSSPSQVHPSTRSQPRSFSTSDTTSQKTRTNIKRPRKGVQHWFDALDDDDLQNDNVSVQHVPPSRVAEAGKQHTDKAITHNSQPGTPSWAVTSFVQSENRKEKLRKGPFHSHPPDLPLASPPMAQENIVDPLTTAPPQRRPSHSSSAGLSTLGEPGPEVAASETGSTPGFTSRHGPRSADTSKRASSSAPEVVTERPPALPSKSFIAEMEGSPAFVGHQTSAKDVVMELEAPQQYFKLPPRPPPKPAAQKQEAQSEVTKSEARNIETSPRETHNLKSSGESVKQSPKTELATQEKKENSPIAHESPKIEVTGCSVPEPSSEEPIVSKSGNEEPSIEQAQPTTPEIVAPPETDGVVTQYAEVREDVQLLPNKAYVATPNIPLPPSPYAESAGAGRTSTATPTQGAEQEELYILPALTYKAPISPRLPPEPLLKSEDALSKPRSDAGSFKTATGDDQAQSEASTCVDTSPKPSTTDEAPLPPPPPALSPPPKEIEEYDPFRADDLKPKLPMLPRLQTPLVKPHVILTSNAVQRGHRPPALTHTRNASSHGSQNGWKAFFTGQPSPVGSNLSIRSVKRESVLEQPPLKSPTLFSATSASSRNALPPSPAGGSVKDASGYAKSADEIRRMSSATNNESANPVETTDGLQGLGIRTTEGAGGNQDRVSAAS